MEQEDWATLQEQLVAAGARAQGTTVLAVRAERGVVMAPAMIAGHACVMVVAPIARAVECDVSRALDIASDLEVGAMIVVKGMLSLRHAVPLADATVTCLVDLATVLAETAQWLSLVLATRPRSTGTSVFAYVAD